MDNKTKSSEISDALRKEIADGRFDTTKRLPSEHELMRRFSAARETVRSAIKDLMSRDTVEIRRGLGAFLVERGTSHATGRFGAIVPDAFHPFYQKICGGIEQMARSKGWSVFSVSLGAGSPHERALKAVEFAEVCRDQKVGGVFFQPLQFLDDDESFNRALLRILDDARISAVQPCNEIGQIAVKMMLDRIAEPGLAPRGVYLSTRLLVRESTMRETPASRKTTRARKEKHK